MALFKNKYRVETTRLKNWDYGNEAAYFITICTKHREHFFGEIRNEEMTLNDIGNIVRNEWQQTPRIRPDMNLTLDEFTVMPNHFHAIIFIGQNQFNGQPDIIGEDSLQNNNKKKIQSTIEKSVFYNPRVQIIGNDTSAKDQPEFCLAGTFS